MPGNAVFKAAFVVWVLFLVLVYPAASSERAEYSCEGAGVMGEFAREMQEIKLLKQRIRAEQGREKTVVISFAGDCTIGTDDNFQYKNSFPHRLGLADNDFGYFFRNVLPVFEQDDLTMVNLETTLTNSGYRVPKKFNFKGDPSYTGILKAGSIEMVNISNNHIYDYGMQGYADTLAALQQADILFCGEENIAFYTVKGVTIGCIGHTDRNEDALKRLEQDIQYAKARAHIVVVSFHWGVERANYPNELQTRLGRFCIDKGADVVAGHHPHVIQGIERYKGRYIVYSLANFCFGGNRNPTDKDTFIFQNEFKVKGRRVTQSSGNIIPCSVSSVSNANDYQPTILRGDEAERVLSRIYKYSSALEYGIEK